MSLPSPQSSRDDFARLVTGETATLAGGLRPLPWIDGLLTATMVSPVLVDMELWLDEVVSEETWGRATPRQLDRAVSILADRVVHIAEQLADADAYRPFLGSGPDRLAAAAEWAAGFRSGMSLQPEPWEPLFESEDVRALLGVIFCLERDEDLPDEIKVDPPFAQVTPERRHELRLMAVEMLPAAVVGLATAYAELADDGDGDLFPDAGLPYLRVAPKIGRNEPCPCGSGKKYKKCCLDAGAAPR
jgi:uncharacterized protein